MTEYSIRPGELAVELENHGYESFWAGDHTHIPTRGQDTPQNPEYAHLMDPFLVLAEASARTTRIRLGTGICLINDRDAIVTAKQVATLDTLSGGRFLFGVGAGWNKEAMLNHGTDPATRWRSMRDRVGAMMEIWTNDIATSDRELVKFGPMWSWPKPAQSPHPPVLIGGGVAMIRHVVAYGDGWAPMTTNWSFDEMAQNVALLRRQTDEAGRGPLPVTAFDTPDLVQLALGGPDKLDDRRWDAYARAGVDRVVVILPPWRERTLPLLERYARFAAGR